MNCESISKVLRWMNANSQNGRLRNIARRGSSAHRGLDGFYGCARSTRCRDDTGFFIRQ